ncbi:GNAT family N-acetyltransferase [Halovivax gelatinilyticus]|uniref:GNAT family N-acetyltransferase n=1 Tax=Halovivax gelatinilyticus TaxID=2961597 RepID=UPI0020CA9769|nr:GNAT family N-acetyltransferase [Halovivax gelatinilyticus]
MTSDVDIRDADRADASALAACYRNAYRTGAERGFPTRMTEIEADTVAEWLAADAVTLVAEPADASATGASDRRQIVGSVRMLEERDDPYMERLAVVDDWQGRGLARALFDRMEAIALDRGHDRMQLTTYSNHPFLFDWYADRGYETVETHEKPDRPYDYVTMERRLSTPIER